jgi:hypothetical protein
MKPKTVKTHTKGEKSVKNYGEKFSRSDASVEITRKIETAMLEFNITHDRARDFVMHDPENAELVRTYIFGE